MEETDAVQANLEKSKRQGKVSLQNLSVEQNKIETLEAEIKELVVQGNAFTMEIKALYEKVSDLRIKEKFLENHLKNEKLALDNIRSKLAECEAKLRIEQEKFSDQERVNAEQQKRLSDQDRVNAEQQKRLSDQDRVNAEQQKRLKKFESKIFDLNTSYSFRIGQAFVNAVTKPGKNTIMLPFRFISLIFEFVFKPKGR